MSSELSEKQSTTGVDRDDDREAYGKPYKVMNETAEPEVPEVATDVRCPH